MRAPDAWPTVKPLPQTVDPRSAGLGLDDYGRGPAEAKGFYDPMTLSRPRRRTRQFLVLALILSAFIHLAGGGLWGFFGRALARITPHPVFMASLQETPAPNAELIRIERRPHAAARPAHEDRAITVAPHPHPRPTIEPAPPRPRHEIAHLRIHAPAQPPPAHARSIAAATPQHVRPVALAPVPDKKRALSDRRIAQLGEDFSKTIADSRETLAGVQADSERAQVVTIKHYSVAFSGVHEGMNPGDGEIFAISQQRIGGTMWYYTRYTYMHGDGTYEADDIPWPFHYPIGNDPFARHDKRIPLQPPPAGYKPDRPLKPILQQFFGGPPVTD
jgi:hypothetical protein